MLSPTPSWTRLPGATVASSSETVFDLDRLLEPISALSIPRFYDSYSIFIDLIVYLFLFNGVARIALEKRFGGTGGRFLISGVGIILAVAMMIAESQFGFTLRSFGPIAVMILLMTVGVTVFGFLRGIGANHILSVSLSVLIIYFSLGALTPELLASVIKGVPWLGLVPILAFLAAVWQLARLLFRGTGAQVLEAANRLRQSVPVRKIEEKLSSSGEDKQALGVARSVLTELSSKEFKQSDAIVRDLEQVEEVVQRQGDNPEVRAFVARKLREVLPKVHLLKMEMTRLREIDKNLARAEFSSYKKLHAWYSQLQGEEKRRFASRIGEEAQKARDEWKSEDFERKVGSHLETLEYLLKRAAQSLLMGRRKDCVKWIRKAIDHERSAESLLKKIRDVKRKLVGIVTREHGDVPLAAA